MTVSRNYGILEAVAERASLEETVLPCPGEVHLPGLRITCETAEEIVRETDAFTVLPLGTIRIRSRQSGDVIRLSGGTKTLKKLFIDKKIPAALRDQLPVICDDQGILGVYSIGANLDRIPETLPAVTVRFHKKEKGE